MFTINEIVTTKCLIKAKYLPVDITALSLNRKKVILEGVFCIYRDISTQYMNE